MQKKAQFTIEFMLLFAMTFLIFLILIVFVTKYIDYSNHESDKLALNTFAENIKKNIVLARDSGQNFEVKIDIPLTYDDKIINVTVDQDTLYVKNNATNYMVMKTIPIVNGEFKLGCNKIKKENGVISIVDC